MNKVVAVVLTTLISLGTACTSSPASEVEEDAAAPIEESSDSLSAGDCEYIVEFTILLDNFTSDIHDNKLIDNSLTYNEQAKGMDPPPLFADIHRDVIDAFVSVEISARYFEEGMRTNNDLMLDASGESLRDGIGLLDSAAIRLQEIAQQHPGDC